MPYDALTATISTAHGAIIAAACVACLWGLATSIAAIVHRLGMLATGFASPFDPDERD